MWLSTGRVYPTGEPRAVPTHRSPIGYAHRCTRLLEKQRELVGGTRAPEETLVTQIGEERVLSAV